ncbi:hypothetical protein MIR68_005340 [Amoeboaphelidium protococcarum]|nr:hypothetical protein MIR68_005340 [Amoeboaphelidium protococcarum]
MDCSDCKGHGRLHTADAFAHENENCLWCEDCPKCNGQGKLQKGGDNQSVVIPDVLSLSIAVESATEQSQNQSSKSPDSATQDNLVIDSRSDQDSIPQLVQSPVSAIAVVSPIDQTPTLEQQQQTKPVSVQVQPTSSAAQQSNEIVPAQKTSTARPSSSLSKAQSHRSSLKSTLSQKSASGSSFAAALRKMNNSSYALTALQRLSTDEDLDNISYADEQELWILETAMQLKHISPTYQPGFYQLFNLARYNSQSHEGYEMALAIREFVIKSGGKGATMNREDNKPDLQNASSSINNQHKVPDSYQLKAPTDAHPPSTVQMELNADKSVKQIFTASESDLMSHLLNPRREDKVTLEVFLKVYRFFMTPHKLLDYVIAYFRVVPAPSVQDMTLKSQSRSANNSPGRMSISGNAGNTGPRISISKGDNQQQILDDLQQNNGNNTRKQEPVLNEREQKRLQEQQQKQRAQYFEKHIPEVRANAIRFLLKWIQSNWHEFAEDPTLLQRVNDFVQNLESGTSNDSDAFYSEALIVKEALRNRQLELTSANALQQRILAEYVKCIEMPIKDTISSTNELQLFRHQWNYHNVLERYDPLQFAEYLTLLEEEQWKLVHLNTFSYLSVLFVQKDEQIAQFESNFRTISGHPLNLLDKYCQWQSMLSFWTSTIVFAGENAQVRAQRISSLVKVASCCKQLCNYATASSILVGIVNSNVFQLHSTLRCIKKSSYDQLQDLVQFFDMDIAGSYKQFDAYQAELMKATPPYIPYLLPAVLQLRMIVNLKMKGKSKYVPFSAFSDIYNHSRKFFDHQSCGYKNFAKLQSQHSPSQGQNGKSNSDNGNGPAASSSSSSPHRKSDRTPLTEKSHRVSLKRKTSSYISIDDVKVSESTGAVDFLRQYFGYLCAHLSRYQDCDNEVEKCGQKMNVLLQDKSYGRLADLIHAEEQQQ